MIWKTIISHSALSMMLTLVLCGFIIVLPFGSPTVLCVGNDGHVALEPNRNGLGDCHSNHSSNGRVDAAHESDEHRCGSCHDYILNHDSISQTDLNEADYLISPHVRLGIPDLVDLSPRLAGSNIFDTRAPPPQTYILKTHPTIVILS